jgi:hypothetical protein
MRAFKGLDTCLWFCALPSDGSEGAREAIHAVEASGGGFLRARQEIPYVDDNPMRAVNRDGNIMALLTVSHPELHPDRYLSRIFGKLGPTASFSYLNDSQTVVWGQAGDAELPTRLDAVAHGQLSFAKRFYPHSHPKLGYIDERGDYAPNEKSVAKTDLSCILWATFFGPSYVAKYGRDFLMQAPGWKHEELDDGGILYVATESYFDWWTMPPENVVKYFQAKVPGVKAYRATRGRSD